MSDIRIEKVTSKKGFKNFLFFPWKVYKGDPNWVPPLIADMKDKLNKTKNPFFEHADIDLFLAYRGNEVVGRIAAILDENHIKFHQEKAGFFGLYESYEDPDVAEKLLDAASNWCRARKMEILRGPMNISMNDECAFLLEGFDSPPVYLLAYNPPYYLELMEQCGLKKAKDLYAYFMTRDHDTAEKVDHIVNKIKNETSVKLRSVDVRQIKEAEKIKYVYNNAWEKNWGFVPWTEKEMEHIFRKLRLFADPKIVILAEEGDKPIGFAFGFPNYNEVIQRIKGRLTPLGILKFLYYKNKIKGMRAVVFGILKEYRNTGVSYLLYSELNKRGIERGYQWCETSWQLEDNDAVNRFTESIGGKLYKKYRIFEKKI
ncbi:MAG: GNAT family N-acetyltransferase [Candidatus Aminicenantes bacterium]|nr:GNAT family N-acetyltransferase [Candidatus Aminicenantes bacterium]